MVYPRVGGTRRTGPKIKKKRDGEKAGEAGVIAAGG